MRGDETCATRDTRIDADVCACAPGAPAAGAAGNAPQSRTPRADCACNDPICGGLASTPRPQAPEPGVHAHAFTAGRGARGGHGRIRVRGSGARRRRQRAGPVRGRAQPLVSEPFFGCVRPWGGRWPRVVFRGSAVCFATLGRGECWRVSLHGYAGAHCARVLASPHSSCSRVCFHIQAPTDVTHTQTQTHTRTHAHTHAHTHTCTHPFARRRMRSRF